MEQYEEEFLQYLRDNGFVHEAYVYDGCLYIEIQWGDWKHDHLRATYLVENFFHKKAEVEQVVGVEQITEEDGSDCYSSIHMYKLIKK